MTIADFVWIAVGETLLVGTFLLGIAVGISLTRKESRHDNGNEGTQGDGKAWNNWHRVERR